MGNWTSLRRASGTGRTGIGMLAFLGLAVAACQHGGGATPPIARDPSANTPAPPAEAAAAPTVTSAVAPPPAAVATPAAKEDPRAIFTAWLKAKLPAGGELTGDASAAPTVVHVAKKGDTWQSIAKAYLDLTDVYFDADLAKEIVNANLPDSKKGVLEGMRLTIPHLLTEPYKTGDAERLGWPEDKQLRGFYVRGDSAAKGGFLSMLDNMGKRGINAIVLDVKDYDGPLTYPSKVPLAIAAGVIKNPPIADFARTVRFAHKKGIRVIARVSCFEDELMAKAKPEISVRGKWGGPYGNGWLDPNNPGAQGYILDLVKEALDNGVDEIELDYVRYPVLAIKNADFKLDPKNPLAKVEVITGFVKKVHEVTKPRNVPLSLDIFGVVAHGNHADIDMLGQDPKELAPECEALSPMVYPSHYNKGFYGFEEPGNHPEIVGIGTKGTLEQMNKSDKRPLAVVRPWLQAMYWKSPEYGPNYLAAEIKSAAESGGVGWLMWNPQQDWSIAYQAVPMKKVPAAAPQTPQAGATQ
jgi:hypothetical protein